MLAPAIFGITNSGVNLAIDLLILFLVVIWLALVYWTYADARRRILDPMLIGCATVASLFPFVGTIVYTIVRPPEFLDDIRERELEMQAAEARLAELGYHLCPHCDYEVERDFMRCPNCMRKLKDPCRTCGKPLDPAWKICPFCESEVAGSPTAARRTRRRRAEQPVAGTAGTSERPPAGTGALSERQPAGTAAPAPAPAERRPAPAAAPAERRPAPAAAPAQRRTAPAPSPAERRNPAGS